MAAGSSSQVQIRQHRGIAMLVEQRDTAGQRRRMGQHDVRRAGFRKHRANEYDVAGIVLDQEQIDRFVIERPVCMRLAALAVRGQSVCIHQGRGHCPRIAPLVWSTCSGYGVLWSRDETPQNHSQLRPYGFLSGESRRSFSRKIRGCVRVW